MEAATTLKPESQEDPYLSLLNLELKKKPTIAVTSSPVKFSFAAPASSNNTNTFSLNRHPNLHQPFPASKPSAFSLNPAN